MYSYKQAERRRVQELVNGRIGSGRIFKSLLFSTVHDSLFRAEQNTELVRQAEDRDKAVRSTPYTPYSVQTQSTYR